MRRHESPAVTMSCSAHSHAYSILYYSLLFRRLRWSLDWGHFRERLHHQDCLVGTNVQGNQSQGNRHSVCQGYYRHCQGARGIMHAEDA